VRVVSIIASKAGEVSGARPTLFFHRTDPLPHPAGKIARFLPVRPGFRAVNLLLFGVNRVRAISQQTRP